MSGILANIAAVLDDAGIILGMGLANKRWIYNVTSSLNGWAHTQNDTCDVITKSTILH